jgi:hypothetical protein
LDHTTVAAHLRALREEDDALIDLIENDRGLQGDLYQLRIPGAITARAGRVSWKAGKVHALRPVFRDLGHPAALVYEALEQMGAGRYAARNQKGGSEWAGRGWRRTAATAAAVGRVRQVLWWAASMGFSPPAGEVDKMDLGETDALRCAARPGGPVTIKGDPL